jgi:hypothetical protein
MRNLSSLCRCETLQQQSFEERQFLGFLVGPPGFEPGTNGSSQIMLIDRLYHYSFSLDDKHCLIVNAIWFANLAQMGVFL